MFFQLVFVFFRDFYGKLSLPSEESTRNIVFSSQELYCAAVCFVLLCYSRELNESGAFLQEEPSRAKEAAAIQLMCQ